jgi:hypothetical protein
VKVPESSKADRLKPLALHSVEDFNAGHLETGLQARRPKKERARIGELSCRGKD